MTTKKKIAFDLDQSTVKLLSRFQLEGDRAHDAMERFLAARTMFDVYAAETPAMMEKAGRDATDLLQARLAAWQNHNFPGNTPVTMALGVIEEMGELDTALSYNDWDEVIDARGDVLVYACQLATMHRLCMRAVLWGPMLWGSRNESRMSAAGLLAHVTLKTEQKIRGLDDRDRARLGAFVALSYVVRSLDSITLTDWRPVLHEVGNKVMKRDWVKNRVTGGES